MSYTEHPVVFACGDVALLGIIARPQNVCGKGVLILVGGPQYRVGSHRQFTLLARQLAENDIASIRFDYRGMGDSEGEVRNFEAIEDDIRSAMDALCAAIPELREIAIWGLCDAASAALFYAKSDERVHRLVLLNPWVHTAEGAAKVYMKHYYVRRLVDPELWHKIRRGQFSLVAATRSFVALLKDRFIKKSAEDGGKTGNKACAAGLPERVFNGLAQFRGKVLLILSGNDFTAQEFLDAAHTLSRGKSLKASWLRRHDIKEANHTFSKKIWRDEVSRLTVEWMNE